MYYSFIRLKDRERDTQIYLSVSERKERLLREGFVEELPGDCNSFQRALEKNPGCCICSVGVPGL